jgi:hypothetical protein
MPIPFRIVPLPAAYLARVRAGLDDLGQPVERHTAAGGEPLRDCLRRARPGANLDAFFGRDDVAFVLARFAAYGCHAPRMERG